MFYGIVMNVIDVPRKINLTPDLMFPHHFHGRTQVINMPHQLIGAPFSHINSKEVCTSRCIGTSVKHLFISLCDVELGTNKDETLP
ncbi:MAG: hypothetical protein M3P47_05585 [Pseudomonadota bacterium]|nr:hypothetical protein [Pseudomonadota bacterium]